MTAKELIAQLSAMPENAVVCHCDKVFSINSTIEAVALFHEIGSTPLVFLSSSKSNVTVKSSITKISNEGGES